MGKPKSERRLAKTSDALDRATVDSYAHLDEDDHPAHKRQAQTMDRYHREHAHNTRDYKRHVHREMRER